MFSNKQVCLYFYLNNKFSLYKKWEEQRKRELIWNFSVTNKEITVVHPFLKGNRLFLTTNDVLVIYRYLYKNANSFLEKIDTNTYTYFNFPYEEEIIGVTENKFGDLFFLTEHGLLNEKKEITSNAREINNTFFVGITYCNERNCFFISQKNFNWSCEIIKMQPNGSCSIFMNDKAIMNQEIATRIVNLCVDKNQNLFFVQTFSNFIMKMSKNGDISVLYKTKKSCRTMKLDEKLNLLFFMTVIMIELNLLFCICWI